MESNQAKVAIVTGASSGIGTAIARELFGAGMKLVLTARRADRLQALATELPGSVALAGDALDPTLPQALLDRAVEAFGRCDVVCNNAGVMLAGPIDSIDIDGVCKMVRVNVEATFRLAYTAARFLKAQGHGHLINTSSVLGTKIRQSAGAYSATKFAIETLSEDMRMELAGTGVSVTCIEPGLVMTELHDRFPVHPRVGLGIDTPLQPADVARCVLFVLQQPAHVRIPRLMVLPADHAI